MTTVADRVKRAVAETLGFPVEKIKDEDAFADDLGADPLDRLEIIRAVEDEFGVNITDETADNLSGVGAHATVGGLIRHVEVIADDHAQSRLTPLPTASPTRR